VEAALSLALETGVASVTLAARTRSPLYISAPDARLDDDLVPLLLPFALPFCAFVGLSPFRLVQCVQSGRTVKPGTGHRPRGSPSNAERQVRSPTGPNNCGRYGN
jgi:hypothetical protein